jgi:L-amino acid N-acyltransferase YncA/protein-tyrosine-phosphatase
MTDQHAGPVLDIYRDGIATGHATFETEPPTWQAFTTGRMSEHRFVALDDGDVLGWVACSPVSERCVYAGVVEHSVYVRPAIRGRGVGRALLEALIDSTERAGIWTIQSGVFPENTASLALHTACGFRVVGIRRRIGRHHGRWRDVVSIERRSPVVGAAEAGMSDRPSVLFVCVHNAGRSQMAAGWLRRLAGDRVEVRSAGTEPANQINPVAIAAMREVGIDITGQIPTVLDHATARASDVIITMGCGDTCPYFPGRRYEDWKLDDPAGESIETVRRIRDDIRTRVEDLIRGLPTGQRHPGA